MWWACLCVWHAHDGDLPVRLAAIVDAVLRFVAEPSEAKRRRVQALGKKVKASSLAAALANAAFFSGGSVSKPGLPKVAPRPFVTGRLVGVVVYLASVSRQPAQYKKVLRYYLDLPHGEIADLLGIPVGTVRSRLRYALQGMRAALDADNRPARSEAL